MYSHTHLHGQLSVKAPFHQQVESNESEKTKVVVPSVLKHFAGKGEKKWEDKGGGGGGGGENIFQHKQYKLYFDHSMSFHIISCGNKLLDLSAG